MCYTYRVDVNHSYKNIFGEYLKFTYVEHRSLGLRRVNNPLPTATTTTTTTMTHSSFTVTLPALSSVDFPQNNPHGLEIKVG